MLLNVLRMIRDENGVPLAAVIRKHLIPLPDNEDKAFGLQHLKYLSHDDEMIERICTHSSDLEWVQILLLVPMHPLMTVHTRLRAAM